MRKGFFSTVASRRGRLGCIDADILELVRQERLLEAAHLSSARGDARGASALFERACEWQNAAAAALQSGDRIRALELALRAGDDALASTAATELALDPVLTDAAVAQLARHGQHTWAAIVFERAGRHGEAARAWEDAGELTRAASLFERTGDDARAARALEAALRRDPDAAEPALRLGALLIRFRKDERAVRSLQRVPRLAPERREALILMVGALERLGFTTAAGVAASELIALGGGTGATSNEPIGEGPGGPLYGRYEVVRQVASSPRARLAEGVDRATAERVALKFYVGCQEANSNASGAARFEDDMRALQALDHPAIVPIRDVRREGPTVILAWMDGGSVEQLLLHGPMAPPRAREIGCSVLDALAAAHRLGILHRGVKAANVLFDATGAARLSDFGGACLGDTSTTITAGDFGPLGSMSPEQRDGHEVTVRSDIFAVGALLHEMLTGRKPSPAARRSRPSEMHAGLGPRHDAVLAQMTAEDERSRPPGAREARELLLSVPWPAAGTVTETVPERPASDRRLEVRLQQREDGSLVDLWTGRRIERVPLSDAALTRARAFAAADHRALQPVLRVDREGGFLWLAALGEPLQRALTPGERTRLVEALEAVRSAGGATPDVDTARVSLGDSGELLVRFETLENELELQRPSTIE